MNENTRAKINQWIKEKKVEIVQTQHRMVANNREVGIQDQTHNTGIVNKPLNRDIILGNSLNVLRSYPDNTFTAVVTDPPYGLSSQPDMKEVLNHWLAGDDYKHTDSGFMGKEWDSFVPGPKIWEEIMRVLKPGGHIFSFSGTRTYDLMVTAMRLAGSEIRDKIAYVCEQEECLSWINGQGFPKSLNIGKSVEKDIIKAIEDAGFKFSGWAEDEGLGLEKVQPS